MQADEKIKRAMLDQFFQPCRVNTIRDVLESLTEQQIDCEVADRNYEVKGLKQTSNLQCSPVQR